MSEKKWEIISSLKGRELVDLLLENRGIRTKKEKEEFLNPKHPSKISAQEVGIDKKELAKAVKRVKKAIKSGEQIVVYGDYDADGICATAIVWEALDCLTAKATPFIPDRFEDGYGINPKSVEKLKEKHKDLALVITVDNGIVAYDALEKARELGIDVIVTDHHTFKTKPKAYAVVHTTKTSGSGVAWFFAKALAAKGGLELAAIGTIADQLPLKNINRSIVKHGLEELNNTTRLGLRKLLMTAGLLDRRIGTYEVGFAIAPRINASGRIAQGMEALRLLCTRNSTRADSLAHLLNDLNRERQDIVDKAVALAERNFPEVPDSVIVMVHEEYHEGVLGLIAGKVVERFSRPAIVLSAKTEIAKASARSIPGFSIIEAIRSQESLILEGGGHDMAAGFSISVKNIAVFAKKINDYARTRLTPAILERKIQIDTLLPFSLINREVYNTLECLEPYGIGNAAPVFATSNVKIAAQRLVGKNHLKLVLEKDGNKLEGIYFNRPDKIDAREVDICYRLNENSWNGKTTIELMIKDIKYGAKV